jgi:hypothetical protein
MTIDKRDAAIDSALRQAFATLPAPGSGHPSEEDWAKFAAGEMSSTERAQVADHTIACAECAAIFRTVALLEAEAPSGAVTPRPSAGADWRWLAAAAAMVLAVGTSVWWLRPVPDGVDRVAGEPAAQAVDSAGAATTVQLPAWASLPAAPDVRLPPDLILAMRGGDVDRDGFLNAFGEAIAPYRDGRFAEAATALLPVAQRYSDVAEVWFYLGTARLYSGAAVEAIEPLQRAEPSQVVGEDAQWLKAVALKRAGRDADAQTALQALCSAPGRYQDQACAAR